MIRIAEKMLLELSKDEDRVVITPKFKIHFLASFKVIVILSIWEYGPEIVTTFTYNSTDSLW